MRSVIVLVISLFIVNSGFSQKIFTGSISTYWSDSLNWSPQGIPTSTTNVIIQSGVSCEVDTDAFCRSLRFDNTVDAASSILIKSGIVLTVSEAVSLTDPAGAGGDQVLNVDSGTLVCDSLILSNTTTASEDLEVLISTGFLKVQSQLILYGATNENRIAISGIGVIEIGGSISVGGDIDLGGNGTIDYNSNTHQTIRAMTYAGNLKLSNGGIKILSGATVQHSGMIEVGLGTTLNLSQFSFTAGGETHIYGALTDDNLNGTNTFQDSITIYGGGSWNITVAESFTLQRGIGNYGTFTSGLGTYVFSTNNQFIGGTSPISLSGSVTVSGSIQVTNKGTLTLGGNLDAAAATFIQGTNASITFNNTDIVLGAAQFGASGNTVTIINNATVTLITTTYHHLIKSGTGILNVDSGVTVNGNITIQSGTLFCRYTIEGSETGSFTLGAGATLTLGQTSVMRDVQFPRGIPDHQITLSGTSTVNYHSDSVQTLNDGVTYGSLFLSTGSSQKLFNLTSFLNVSNNLTISFGVTINAASFDVDVDGTISGTGTLTFTTGNMFIAGSYINGTLNTGNGTVTYNGGDQTIRAATYNNLVVTGSGTKSPQTITVNRNLTIDPNSIFALSTNNLTVNGTLYVNGTFTETSTSGNNTLDSVIINGTWNCSVAEAFSISGLFSNAGTFISGSGTYTFTGTGTKLLAGKLTFAGNVALNNSVTVQTADSVFILGNLTGGNVASTWQQLAGAYVSVGGTLLTTGTLAATVSSNTVFYSGSGDQTIKVTTYHHLGKSGVGNLTTSTGVTVNGDLIIREGSLQITQSMAGSVGGKLYITGTGQLLLGQTSSTVNVLFPSNFLASNILIDTTATVQLLTNGAQTLPTDIQYGNLIITTGSLSKSITLPASLVLKGGLQLTQTTGTVALNMGANNLVLTGDLTGNGTLTFTTGTFTLKGHSHAFLGVLTPGDLVVLNGVTQQQILGLAYRNMEVNNNAGILLNSATSISGLLHILNGSVTTGGNLTLLSDAVETARLVGPAAGGYISGNVKVQRYIPSIARRWRFLGSQVQSTTLQDWKNEVFMTAVRKGAGGFDSALTTKSGIYHYDETHVSPERDSGWTEPEHINTVIQPGKGYRLFIRGDRNPGRLDGTISTQNEVTLDVSGVPNQGSIPIPVSYTATGVDAEDGWNLIANPFPAAISWDLLHDEGRSGTHPDYSGTSYAHLAPDVYMYDPQINNYSSYNAVTNIGTGDLSEGYLPSGAAFFVKTSAILPSITLKEQHKIQGDAEVIFKRQSFSILRLKLQLDELNKDEAVLALTKETPYEHMSTLKLSKGTAAVFFQPEDHPLMVWVQHEDALPDTIWVHVSLPDEQMGMITFQCESFSQLQQYQWWDAIKRKINPISEGEKIEVQQGWNRYALIRLGTTGANEKGAGQEGIRFHPTVASSTVLAVASGIIHPIEIYVEDGLGRRFSVPWNSSTQGIELNISTLNSGWYFATFILKDGQMITSKFLKQ